MSEINLVAQSGTIFGTPEIKSTSGGKTLATFYIQQENGYGQYKKDPFVFKITAWGDLAETVGGLPEGTKLTVYGRMTSRNYEYNGPKTAQEIVANVVDVRASTGSNVTRTAAKPQTRPARQEIDDSDIPF